MDTPALYQLFLKHPFIATDTRQLLIGSIFFALSGANYDGNRFAAQALQNGAVFAVIDNPAFAVSEQYIVVANVLESLQQLACHHRRQFNIPFIAITGSNGKTTTKELLAAVLGKQYITYATEGNFNNHIGIPLTLLKIKQDAQIAIIEMGANHQKEIESYCKIAMPTHGIITNCGKAHLEGFGGIEGVRKGKGELYDYLRTVNGTIFINTDLSYLHSMANGITHQITYGAQNAIYTAQPIMQDIYLNVVLNTPIAALLDTHLVGAYNYPNALAAIAVGLHFKVQIADIKTALYGYVPDNSRSQWLQKGRNKIILDAYNANPSSMKEAILNFVATNLPNKTLWLGGMKEMGADEAKEHVLLINLIATYPWAGIVLVGNEFKAFQNKYTWFQTSVEAANFVKTNAPVDSSILIKGSRGSKMEVMLDAL